MKKRIYLILLVLSCILGITACTKKENQKKQIKDVNGFFNNQIKVYKGKYYKIDSNILYKINLDKYEEKKLAKLKTDTGYIQDWNIQNSKIYYTVYTDKLEKENAKIYVFNMKNKENKKIAELGNCKKIVMDKNYVYTELEDTNGEIAIKKYNLKKATEKTIYSGEKYFIELAIGDSLDKKQKGIIKGSNGEQIVTDYYVYPTDFFVGSSIDYLYFDGKSNRIYQIDLNKYEQTKKIKKKLIFSREDNYALNIQEVTSDYILYTDYKNISSVKEHFKEDSEGTEINIYDIKNKSTITYTTKYPYKEEIVNWTSNEVITSHEVSENKKYLIKYDAKHPDGLIILKDKEECSIVDTITDYCNGRCIERTSLFNIGSNQKKNEEEFEKFLAYDDELEGTWKCKELNLTWEFKKGRKVIVNGKEYKYVYPRQTVREIKKNTPSRPNTILIYSENKGSSIKIKQDVLVAARGVENMIIVFNGKYYSMDNMQIKR